MANGSLDAISSIDAGTLTPIATNFGVVVTNVFDAISGSLQVAESGSSGIAKLISSGIGSVGN